MASSAALMHRLMRGGRWAANWKVCLQGQHMERGEAAEVETSKNAQAA